MSNDNFGICPECSAEKTCVFYNIGPTLFKTCPDCKIRWEVGWNILSGWKDETEEIWEASYDLLKTYRNLSGEDKVDEIINKEIEENRNEIL